MFRQWIKKNKVIIPKNKKFKKFSDIIKNK